MNLPITMLERPHTPEQIEALIELNTAAVNHFGALASGSYDDLARGFYRDEARKHAAKVAELVAMRSPETVRQMEVERGIA